MAGATLLAIISFLFLGVIIQLLGGRGPGSQIQTVAESRRFGKITNYDIQRLRDNQQVLHRFLSVLRDRLTVNVGADESRRYALIPLAMEVERVEQMLNSEQQLVNMWLVSHFAQDEGISPDWDDVANWLKRLTGDMSGNYLNEVYADAVQDVAMTPRGIETLLAQHLRWVQSYERFELSISAVTPATRWDWFQRLFRQVTIEAAAVPVDSYIDQVGEPNTNQLNALFEQYKNRRYNPISAESGFVMPAELAYQYVIAEPTQELLDSITDEEMLTYYEENKNTLFRKPITPIPQMPGMVPGSVPFSPRPAGGLTPPAVEDAPSLPDLPVIEAPASEESVSPTEEPVKQETETAPEEARQGRQPTWLQVVYQVDSIHRPADVALVVEEQESKENVADTEGEASETPADLSELYRPFDEVKDEIREDLALQKVAEQLPSIQEKVQEHAKIYHQHIEKEMKPPVLPDWSSLAAERGLKLVTVPMGDLYASMHTDLARDSLARQQLFQMYQSLPLPFAPEMFINSTGRRGMIWVTEQKNELRPQTLNEVKEIVVKRWKEIEARPLAMKKAEELADETRKSGKSLTESLGSRMPVVETEQFTWQILYPNFGRPVPGEVREKGVVAGNSDIDNRVIVAPGNDFMAAVYSLQVGETGVVFNQPQNRAYIVRVTGSSPTDESLWERFQSFSAIPGMDRAYMSAGFPEMYAVAYEAWLDEIRNKTGFRWVNKPDDREMYGE